MIEINLAEDCKTHAIRNCAKFVKRFQEQTFTQVISKQSTFAFCSNGHVEYSKEGCKHTVVTIPSMMGIIALCHKHCMEVVYVWSQSYSSWSWQSKRFQTGFPSDPIIPWGHATGQIGQRECKGECRRARALAGVVVRSGVTNGSKSLLLYQKRRYKSKKVSQLTSNFC